MRCRCVLIHLCLIGGLSAICSLTLDQAEATQASPPTCAYGGNTCKVCEEFEIVPRPHGRSTRRCVKCVLDKSKTACIIKFF